MRRIKLINYITSLFLILNLFFFGLGFLVGDVHADEDEPWSFVLIADSPAYGPVIDALGEALESNDDVKLIISAGDYHQPWYRDREPGPAKVYDDHIQDSFSYYFENPLVPFLSVLGNHNADSGLYTEYTDPECSDIGFFVNEMGLTLFERLPAMENYNPGPHDDAYACSGQNTTYSFDYKNVHFVFINQYYKADPDITYGDAGYPLGCVWDENYEWLARDLESNTQPLIFVVGHEPAWPIDNSKDHCGDSLDDDDCPGNYVDWDDPSRPKRDRFWQLLNDYNVIAHLSGHLHEFSARAVYDLSDFDIDCDHWNCYCQQEYKLPEVASGEVITPGNGVIEHSTSAAWNYDDFHIVRIHEGNINFSYFAKPSQEASSWNLIHEFSYDATELLEAVAATNIIYVDNSLPDDCLGEYDVSSGSCGTGTETAYNRIDDAAQIAEAGHTVLIREGTYNEYIRPMNSGIEGSPVTFKNYGSEEAIITNSPYLDATQWGDRDGFSVGFYIWEKSHIVIEGIVFDNIAHGWGRVVNSHHITLKNNRFTRANAEGFNGGINFITSNHNKIINNIIDDGNDNLGFINSHHNLIEGNTITKGRHTLWAIKCGNFNVIRNNYFHNEIQKIGEIYDCNDPVYGADMIHFGILLVNSTKHNLVENNVFAYTAFDDGDGPYSHIQYAGQNGIIRNNLFYDSQGIALALARYGGEADYNLHNRIYNNIFYNNIGGGTWTGNWEIDPVHFNDNILVNNIYYKNTPITVGWADGHLSGSQITHRTMAGFEIRYNNILDEIPAEDEVIWVGYDDKRSLFNVQQYFLSLYSNNIEVDPDFVDEENYNFHLNEASPMIDRGAFLTKTNGIGSSASLTVSDAKYFYNGFGIEGVVGDFIQLEGSTDIAQVLDIDYDTNTLQLDRSITWTHNQGVSLTFSGEKPDIGAYEYIETLTPPDEPVIPDPPPPSGDDPTPPPSDDPLPETEEGDDDSDDTETETRESVIDEEVDEPGSSKSSSGCGINRKKEFNLNILFILVFFVVNALVRRKSEKLRLR